MAGDHREETPDTGGRPGGQHAPVSRRSVLRGAAGASAAGLVAGSALTALPAVAAARPAQSGQPAEQPGRSAATMTPDAAADRGSAAGPLVIHVRDAHTGEMDIFAGTTRTRLHDPALAARLVRASQ
ncbi:MAG: hypothetical protein JWL68_1448 [Actinomycetia bacterium]|jgi:hypothetical protein|nr:hypothetical protein [Actinomycetes bacterium]MDX6338276.1 hypothetical protein [Streptosporangiaceae bacterium]